MTRPYSIIPTRVRIRIGFSQIAPRYRREAKRLPYIFHPGPNVGATCGRQPMVRYGIWKLVAAIPDNAVGAHSYMRPINVERLPGWGAVGIYLTVMGTFAGRSKMSFAESSEIRPEPPTTIPASMFTT